MRPCPPDEDAEPLFSRRKSRQPSIFPSHELVVSRSPVRVKNFRDVFPVPEPYYITTGAEPCLRSSVLPAPCELQPPQPAEILMKYESPAPRMQPISALLPPCAEAPRLFPCSGKDWVAAGKGFLWCSESADLQDPPARSPDRRGSDSRGEPKSRDRRRTCPC